jgi:23S rRNA (cytidine1920-2'-O)/16S rRNA (cytidine1409-2'-O)-methyltransferase
VHAAVLREVRDGLAGTGLFVHGAVVSPLRGADGNVEFLVHADRRAPAIDDPALLSVVPGAEGCA